MPFWQALWSCRSVSPTPQAGRWLTLLPFGFDLPRHRPITRAVWKRRTLFVPFICRHYNEEPSRTERQEVARAKSLAELPPPVTRPLLVLPSSRHLPYADSNTLAVNIESYVLQKHLQSRNGSNLGPHFHVTD